MWPERNCTITSFSWNQSINANRWCNKHPSKTQAAADSEYFRGGRPTSAEGTPKVAGNMNSSVCTPPVKKQKKLRRRSETATPTTGQSKAEEGGHKNPGTEKNTTRTTAEKKQKAHSTLLNSRVSPSSRILLKRGSCSCWFDGELLCRRRRDPKYVTKNLYSVPISCVSSTTLVVARPCNTNTRTDTEYYMYVVHRVLVPVQRQCQVPSCSLVLCCSWCCNSLKCHFPTIILRFVSFFSFLSDSIDGC